MRRVRHLLAGIAMATAVAGLRGLPPGLAEEEAERGAVAGEPAGVRTPARTRAEADGAVLYQRHCAPCHGPAGRGDGPEATLFTAPPRDLRTDFLARYAMEELARRVRTGAPLALALDPAALRARATEVEAIAVHLERLPRIDWRLAERGQEVFVERCELCHGPFGRPGATLPRGLGVPRDLADPELQRSISDADLALVARHGRKGMPALTPRVAEADGPSLVAYLRLLSPGFELYSRYCSACHGDDGRSASVLAEGLRRPAIVFDRAYFAPRDPEEVRAAVWHMAAEQTPAMPHFRRTLDDSEARAIIDYLKRMEASH